MDLIVVRHAEARPLARARSRSEAAGRSRRPGPSRGPGRPDVADAERPLTPRGRRQARRTARALERLGLVPALLLHSPMRRAVETADALSAMRKCGPRRETATLASAPSRALLSRLRGRRVAVVGHEPWLSQLVAGLVLGDAAKAPSVRLRKGGVALLRGRAVPGGMVLRALLLPKVLSLLARPR